MFDPVGGAGGHEPEEAEPTPIFDALARRATDPVERFCRDPLHAPLPPGAPEDAPGTPLDSVAPPVHGGKRRRPAGRHRALRSVECHRARDGRDE